MRGLKNKVIVIAGGGGIGAATVERLADEGTRIVLGDLDGGHAEEVAQRIRARGGDCVGVAFDIAEESSVQALIDCALERHGGLDALHANAADLQVIHQDSNVLEEPLEVFDRTIAVNLRGHWLCTRAALPALLQRGGGSLVYTSSGAAVMGEPQRPAYAIAKAGIEALVRHVASRWGKENIRANAVAPGLVLTPSVAGSMQPEFLEFALKGARSPRLGAPEDIASMVAFLCSDEAEWINGQVLGVNGGAVI